MVIWNLLGMAGAMTAGFVSWLVVLALGLGGKEFLAVLTFLMALFGSAVDRVPAGRALGAYFHPFTNLGEGHHDPRIRVALFGFPLITAPYVALAFAAGITWVKDTPALSEGFIRLMLMSCGASLAVCLATMPLRSIRDSKDERGARSR
jgi:hypothetical protein